MTEAHGKLILFGEFSVLERGAALGITLPCFTRIHAEKTEESVAVDKTLLCGEDLPQKALYVEATVPRTGGFGSSAALSVALARCFSDDEKEVWARAQRMEHSYHGQASGVDTRLAMGEPSSVRAFHPSDGAELPSAELVTLPALRLVVGGLPRGYSTKEAISRVDRSASLVGELVACAKDALAETADAAELGRLARAAHAVLRRMGLQDEGVEDALREGAKRGALGGKLSGAGGAFFLVCADEESASRVREGLIPVIRRYGGVGPWIMNPGA